MTGTVFAVTSGKGGVGKTTTALNLAVALRRDDHTVGLVDADLGMANLGAMLGLDREHTIHDVLAGQADPHEATAEEVDGFGILPGTRDLSEYADTDPKRLPDVIDALRDRYDFLVVDTGAGLGYEDLLPIDLADEIVLVTTPDPTAIGDTRKILEFSDAIESAVRGVVVTRTTEETDPEAVAAEVGTDLLVAVPEDEAVTESNRASVPLERHAPDSPSTKAYRQLASILASAPRATRAETGSDEQALGAGSGPAEGSPDGAGAAADAGSGEESDAPPTAADVGSAETADGEVESSPEAGEAAASPTPDAGGVPADDGVSAGDGDASADSADSTPDGPPGEKPGAIEEQSPEPEQPGGSQEAGDEESEKVSDAPQAATEVPEVDQEETAKEQEGDQEKPAERQEGDQEETGEGEDVDGAQTADEQERAQEETEEGEEGEQEQTAEEPASSTEESPEEETDEAESAGFLGRLRNLF